MSGLPDIDAEDWEKNTEYSGYDEDSDIIKVRCSLILFIYYDQMCTLILQWFWELVHAFDRKKLAILLQFATGRSVIVAI